MKKLTYIFTNQLEEIEQWCKKYNVAIYDVFDYPVASFIKIMIEPTKLQRLLADKGKLVEKVKQ